MNRMCSLLVLTAFAVSAQAQTTWNPIVNMSTVGYSDSFSRTVVRTNGNIVYYCMNASGISSGASRVKVFKGNGPVPTSFTEMDSAHEPTDSSRIIGVDCRLNSTSGVISIIYQLTSPLSANYITYDTNTDTFGIAEQIAAVNHAPTLRYLSKVSLALDSSGIPHVTYGGDNEGFSYNNRVGGAWHAAFQITTNFDDMHPSMTFGTDGVLHLAWMNFDSPRSILYRERSVAGTWSSTEVVDGNVGTFGDKVDQSPSIALTIDNKPLILYHNQADSNGYVLIKRRDAASSFIDVSPLPAHTAAGHAWALSVDANGNWYICGHGNQNVTPVQPQCLMMTYASSTWSSPTTLINNGTPHDGSASMRYDVVWPGDQTHIDVAYHDENSPPDAWYFDATVPGPGSSGNSASAALSTNALTFPNQTVGTSSSPQSVTVTSTGATNLDMSSIASPAGFSETDNCSAPLPQGTSCQISITFTPPTSGSFTGNVTITDNAPNTPQVISVSGTGVTQAFSITGTISPAAGGSGASVSLKGTASATITANSSGVFTFSGLANGNYTITPSHAGETFSPTNQTVSVSGSNVSGINFTAIATTQGESLFTSQTPALISQSDGASTNYELGVVFSSGVAGSITGIRFWKDTRETGTHTGHLWAATGQLLGTAVFSGETSSGWQQASLQMPVQIAANTQYVASVNTGATYFVTTVNGLASKVSNQDLSSVVGNNGLYGSPGSFPLNTYQHSNYFRDVVFTPGSSVFSASGNVSPVSSAAGTTLTLSGTRSATATPDANGNYTFSGLPNGTYTVTPSKSGVTFNPANLSFTVNGSNVTALNFASTTQTGSISGAISPTSGGSGATLTLAGAANATVTADSNGNYTFSSLAYGNYTITPSRAGFTFTPTSQPVTVNSSSIAGINFTAVPQTRSISGTVSPVTGGGGATITLSGSSSATITATSAGTYAFNGLSNGTYTVTPSNAGYTFNPASQSVTISNSDVANVNFTASAVSGSNSGAIAIDTVISRDQGAATGTVTTPAFSTLSGELLLALISTDVPTSSGTNNTVTGVTGAGLTWVLAVRTNTERGTSEIWRAFAPSALSNVSVSASLAISAASSMTVVTFTGVNSSGTNGSGAIGATGRGAGRGAPAASLTATGKNSWVIGVGNDWDNAIARTMGANQVLVHSYLAPIGDTYWVQRLTVPTVSGTIVSINDTAPTSDQYNLSICEILPSQ